MQTHSIDRISRKMNLNPIESGLSMLCRIINVGPTPDPETIDDTKKVTIIDSETSDLIALKAYLYHLIERSIKDEANADEIKDWPNVMIFDGKFIVDFDECCKLFPTLQSKRVKLFQPIDDLMMIEYLRAHLQTHMVVNPKLRLFMIISNPDILFPTLVDQINALLFAQGICTHIVFIIDRLDRKQWNFYNSQKFCQILRCKLSGDSDMNDVEQIKKLSIHIHNIVDKSVCHKSFTVQ